ncbi:MAG: DNA-formamidopyrimidine glycosylase [bacterium]|nr:DNA-formamidopyrimidine glycosylase [bacterium]
MPELPEVETVARSLRPHLIDRKIHAFERYWPKALHDVSLPAFRKAVTNQRIVDVRRRAKFVIVVLERGFVLVHLRMTGKLYPLPEIPPKRERNLISCAFVLSDGSNLIFEDQRRFGRVYWFANQEELELWSQRFGPEPLEAEFTPHWLTHSLAGSKRQVKPLLLDQEFIAGLGNIYVDESLWLAKIHPLTPAAQIPKAKVKRLHGAIQEVLEKSIRMNGTSFMNFKFLGGYEGGYTDELLVFGRQGQPCLRCKREIVKLKVAQRGTHICERCQAAPA